MFQRVGRVLVLLGFGVLLQCAKPIEVLESASDPTRGLPEARLAPRFSLETAHHRGDVLDIDVSPDGKTIASVGRDKIIRIWNTERSRVRRYRLPIGPGTEGGLFAVGLSPDGRFIAVGGCHGCAGFWEGDEAFNVYMIDVKSGEVAGRGVGHLATIRSLAFSPDGKRLASGSADGTVRIWRISSRGRLRDEARLAGHGATVQDIAWFPDGKRVVTASADGLLGYWAPHPAGGWYPLFTSSGHTSGVTSVEVSPDALTIFSGSSDRTVRTWDATTGEEVDTLLRPGGFVNDLELSPDGLRLAVASSGNDEDRGVHVVPIVGGDAQFAPSDNTIFALRWVAAASGTLVTAQATTGRIDLLDAETLTSRRHFEADDEPIFVVRTKGLKVAWRYGGEDPDPFHVLDLGTLEGALREISSDAAAQFIQAERIPRYSVRADFDQGVLYTRQGNYETGWTYNGLTCWATGPGHSVMTGTHWGEVYIADIEHTYIRSCTGHGDSVRRLAIFEDRDLFVSAGEGRVLRIWNRTTCELLVSIYAETSGDWVAWSPLGFYAASGEGGKRLRVATNRGMTQPPSANELADSNFARHDPTALIAILEAETAASFMSSTETSNAD